MKNRGITPFSLFALTIYQINAISLVFYSMVRYIYIRKHKKLKQITEILRGYTYKITHISAAKFSSVAHLVSF